MRYRVSGSDWSEEYEVRRGPLGREWEISHPETDATHSVRVQPIEGKSIFRLIVGGQTHVVTVLPGNRPGRPWRLLLDDRYHELDVRDEFDLLQEVLGQSGGSSGHEEVASPMPGIIRKILVEPGEAVESDQSLLILEAMKMENEVRAPIAGKISKLAVKAGQTVAAGDPLVEIEG